MPQRAVALPTPTCNVKERHAIQLFFTSTCDCRCCANFPLFDVILIFHVSVAFPRSSLRTSLSACNMKVLEEVRRT